MKNGYTGIYAIYGPGTCFLRRDARVGWGEVGGREGRVGQHDDCW
jgi:hypothetical protein